MSKPRKKYDKKFKFMAVELSNTRSDLVQLAKELGIRSIWKSSTIEKESIHSWGTSPGGVWEINIKSKDSRLIYCPIFCCKSNF
jgi:hypothetical protein